MIKWFFLTLMIPCCALAQISQPKNFSQGRHIQFTIGVPLCLKSSDHICYGRPLGTGCYNDPRADHRETCVSQGDLDITAEVSCKCE